MNRYHRCVAVILAVPSVFILLCVLGNQSVLAESPGDAATKPTIAWPQWRGETSSGSIAASAENRYPIRWDVAKGKNVEFDVSLPGRGGSTPAVVDGKIYLTSGIDGQNVLMALDANNGKLLWQQLLGDDAGNKHRKGGGSNPSVVVGKSRRGKTVAVAYFRSGDIAGVDDSGNVLWQKNLQQEYGDDTLWWDLGSSPLLVDTTVVVAVVQTGPSYLVRLDLDTGEVIWKTDRDVAAVEEAAQTYATPIMVEFDDRRWIAVLGADHLTLHDLKSGRMVAKQGGFNPTDHKYFRSIASPAASGRYLIFPYARGETLSGIDLSKLVSGNDSVEWQLDQVGCDVPSPSVRGDLAFVVDDSKQAKGTVAAIDLKTGEVRWTVQLPKTRVGYSSSPLVAGSNLYVVREDATTFVIGPVDGSQPEILAENEIEGGGDNATVASPVPLGQDAILIRTADRLIKVRSEE